MIDVEFSDIEKRQETVSALERRVSDYSGFFNDFAVGRLENAVRAVFETEGYGTWAPLDPFYAAAKALRHPGQTLLRREDAYLRAATGVGHPGNVFDAGPTELVYGVSGDYFASRFGENYPARHESGIGVSARPVFGLLAEDADFDAEVARQLDDWASEEIAVAL